MPLPNAPADDFTLDLTRRVEAQLPPQYRPARVRVRDQQRPGRCDCGLPLLMYRDEARQCVIVNHGSAEFIVPDQLYINGNRYLSDYINEWVDDLHAMILRAWAGDYRAEDLDGYFNTAAEDDEP